MFPGVKLKPAFDQDEKVKVVQYDMTEFTMAAGQKSCLVMCSTGDWRTGSIGLKSEMLLFGEYTQMFLC